MGVEASYMLYSWARISVQAENLLLLSALKTFYIVATLFNNILFFHNFSVHEFFISTGTVFMLFVP